MSEIQIMRLINDMENAYSIGDMERAENCEKVLQNC